jgi:hypothetical protein
MPDPILCRALQLESRPDLRDALSDALQRATGGRRRAFKSIELARWEAGLCIWCGQTGRDTSRYCSDRCRVARNQSRSAKETAVPERARRTRALCVITRDTYRARLLSWYTLGDGTSSDTLDSVARGLLSSMAADLEAVRSASRLGVLSPSSTWDDVKAATE